MTRADWFALGFGAGVGAELVYRAVTRLPTRLEAWCWQTVEQLATRTGVT